MRKVWSIRALTTALLLGGCATAMQTFPSSRQQDALLRHLLADVDSVPMLRGAPLRIDPRPVVPGYTISSVATTHRAAIIRSTGQDTVTIDGCQGPLVPSVSHAGCPDQPLTVVAFGWLRPTHQDSAVVRIGVDWRRTTPSGQADYGYIYTLRRTGSGWVTVQRYLLGIAE